MRCNDNPQILRDLIRETINEKQLIPEKLGMLLHVFADTFSHQGFSGLISKENDVRGLVSYQEKAITFALKSFGRSIKRWFLSFIDQFVPAYGHAQVYKYPDIPYGKWEYIYDKSDDFSNVEEMSKNDNTTRYKDAFTMIASDFLDAIVDKNGYDSGMSEVGGKLQNVLEVLVTPVSQKKKIKLWKKLIESFTGSPAEVYNEIEWLEEVFEDFEEKKYEQRVVYDAVLDSNYTNTSWYAFLKSMKWYKNEFIQRNRTSGLDLPY